MKRLALTLTAATLAAGCGGASASPSPNTTAKPDGAAAASLVIQHATRGCHTWSLNGMPFAARQVATLMHGNGITITDGDVMPHTLVQLAGPPAVMTGAHMRHMDARAKLVFPTPGTYVFKTVAGEDYPSAAGIQTVGPDNVLRLTVHVL